MKLTSIVLVLFSLLFVQILANEGCSPELNSSDCQNPKTHVCTKILLGTTPAAKAKGKYFYQCLPREWADSAKKKVESVVGKTLEVKSSEETGSVAQEHHLLQVPISEIHTQKAKPASAKPVEKKVETTEKVQQVKVAQAKQAQVKKQEVKEQEAKKEEADDEEDEDEEADNNDEDTESYEEDF
eukprot:gene1266-11353_t